METRISAGGRVLRLFVYNLIGLDADVLFQILLFIPCQIYASLFNFSVENLQEIWETNTLVTLIQFGLTSIFTTAVVPRILTALSYLNRFILEKG